MSQHTPSAEIPEFQSERSNAPLDPDFDPAGGVGGTAADGDAVPDGTNDAEPMDPDWFGRSGEPGFRAEIGKPYVAVMPALGLLAGIVAMLVFGGTSTLILVASIVFIIFMHELGHYVMARRSGMKVTEFMIGFGPRIASFRRGDVEFGLKAIPAGAYVKIIGMVSNEEVAPGDEDKTYRVKGFWARLGVAVAGSTMHFLMALILLFIALTNSGIQDERDWLIREVVAGSTADQMGMKAGDRLISLNDTRTETFSDMVDVARASGGKMVTATFERDGTTMTGTARTAQRLNIFGTIGEDLVLFETTDGRLATSLLQGGRIAGAGLQDGDVVTAIDGIPLTSIDEVGTLLSEPRYESQGTLRLSVLSKGSDTNQEIKVDFGGGVAASDPRGFFGVGQEVVAVPLGVSEAIPETFSRFGMIAKQTVVGMGSFFSPSGVGAFASRVFSTAPGETTVADKPTPQEALGGANSPDNNRMISIVGAIRAGSSGFEESGWISVVQLLIAINIAVGILNLLPLTPLDGGHVVVACYERVRELIARDGKRYMVDAQRLVPVSLLVLLLLGSLGLMSLYLDLADPVKI